MFTDNASTIPKMITRETNINQAMVFLYWVFQGFITTDSDPILKYFLENGIELWYETILALFSSQGDIHIKTWFSLSVFDFDFSRDSNAISIIPIRKHCFYFFEDFQNSNKEFDFQKDLEINFWDGAIADLDEILVENFYIKMSQWCYRPSAGKTFVYSNQHVLKTTIIGCLNHWLTQSIGFQKVELSCTTVYVTVYSRISANRVGNIFNSRL